MAAMKVLLIDDHPLILTALQSVIEGLGDGVQVVGAESAQAARDELQADGSFDLVLLDLQLGDADGFDVLTEFRAAYPSVPVVVVSASDRASDVIRSIDLGAMGFVPKRSSNRVLTDALRLVISGGIYVPPMGLDTSASADAPREPSSVAALAAQTDYQTQADLTALGLTPRQRDVLTLLLQGKPNKLIARELNVAVETVKDHVAAVLRTLNVNSRTQAVLAVAQMTQNRTGFMAWRSRNTAG
jgi:DNA-binding NarL/FixJ family response regulator